MQLDIVPATPAHLEACVAALCASRLGEAYFPAPEKARAALTECIIKEELFVALDATGACLGFIAFTLNGAFHSFPYLHIVAVAATARGRGVGTQLLAYFERVAFAEHSKAFLVVADFNPEAQRLYERLGYRQVGAIPNLYKDGVTEVLMVKERDTRCP